MSLKVSTSMAKLKDNEDSRSEELSKDEEMGLFIRHYNRYKRKNSLKNFDKNLIKFRNSNPPKKWEDENKEK